MSEQEFDDFSDLEDEINDIEGNEEGKKLHLRLLFMTGKAAFGPQCQAVE